MSISVGNITSVVALGAQSTVPLAAPAGITVGDLLVIVQAGSASSATATVTSTGGTWNPISAATDTNQIAKIWAWYKIATSGDIGTAVTIGTGIYRYWTAGFYDIIGSSTSSPTATVADSNVYSPPVAPAITTTSPGSLLIWSGGCNGAASTGWSSGTAGFSQSGMVSNYILNQSGTISGPTATGGGSTNWAAQTLAIAPPGTTFYPASLIMAGF